MAPDRIRGDQGLFLCFYVADIRHIGWQPGQLIGLSSRPGFVSVTSTFVTCAEIAPQTFREYLSPSLDIATGHRPLLKSVSGMHGICVLGERLEPAGFPNSGDGAFYPRLSFGSMTSDTPAQPR
jgi:hypothetical protein